MLTRENAKSCLCPHFLDIISKNDAVCRILTGEEVKNFMRCKAEGCTKWIDIEETVDLPERVAFRYCETHCQDFKDNYQNDCSADNILSFKIEHCNKCQKRFWSLFQLKQPRGLIVVEYKFYYHGHGIFGEDIDFYEKLYLLNLDKVEYNAQAMIDSERNYSHQKELRSKIGKFLQDEFGEELILP